MKWMKKATNIILIAVLALGISVGSLVTTCQKASAIGVIGSNAVKSVVIGSMEKAGVTFVSKEAKEKAFEAWNMKAYQKWQADEAAGRNADLWATWHAFEQNPSTALKAVPDAPDKPGMGKFLLDATIFGMAIGIGAEIGYAIEDAQIEQRALEYLATDLAHVPSGADQSSIYGFTKSKTHPSYGEMKVKLSLYGPNDILYMFSQSVLEDDPSLYVYATNFQRLRSTEGYGWYWQFDVYGVTRGTDGQLTEHESKGHVIYENNFKITPVSNHDSGGYKYEALPKPDHVPQIAPVPELAPLVAPVPDLAVIPEVLPPAVPVEVIIPSAPESDPLWDGVINEPYVPPTPGDGEDPDKPPGTDPDGDPDKPPGTDPDGDPDAPPGTDPDGDTDAPPKEDEDTPPKEDEETPPKEDEENSCDASLKKPDFKKVGVAFTNAFPFSIPWDIKRFFDSAFSGIGSKKPEVDLSFIGSGITMTIPDYFDSWVDVMKNIIVLLFDISLIWMFARFMQRGGGD